MINLSFNLPPQVSAAILETVMEIGRNLPGGLAREFAVPSDDKDIETFWLEDLRVHLREEYTELIKLLRDEALSKKVHEIEEDSATSILRAASAIRIVIRENTISNIQDEELEKGMVNPALLSEKEKHHYYCYLFLADLQMILIEQLDPDSTKPVDI